MRRMADCNGAAKRRALPCGRSRAGFKRACGAAGPSRRRGQGQWVRAGRERHAHLPAAATIAHLMSRFASFIERLSRCTFALYLPPAYV
jgi:hypothetical protein